MTTPRARLTDADIRRLVNAGDDERAAAAHKLCRAIGAAVLSERDRAAAQKIIRVMADDTAELVRRALAVTLRASDILPRDVALRLARDVESVALPVVSASPVFTDEDLIEIVRAGSAARQIAVARRPWVSRDVAEAVAAEGVEAAVQALCANDNGDVSEKAMNSALARFPASADIVNALAYRQVLPLRITERLVELASQAVREHLVTRHALAPEVAIRLALGARERATVDLVDQAAAAADLTEFCSHLNARRALTPSLLLRAIARGNMAFFESGVAELSGVAHQRAWLMIHDSGPLGLKAIYDRAGLPPRLFQAFRAGVDTWRGLQGEGGALDRDRFQQRMLERFLTLRPHAPKDDIGYMIEALDRPPASQAQPAHANAA